MDHLNVGDAMTRSNEAVVEVCEVCTIEEPTFLATRTWHDGQVDEDVKICAWCATQPDVGRYTTSRGESRCMCTLTNLRRYDA